MKNPFSKAVWYFRDDEIWRQHVARADYVFAQVERALKAAQINLEETPRCPDVRVFARHASAGEPGAKPIYFMNPENHAKGGHEELPANGPKTAMIIVPAPQGNLSDQFELARYIVEKFGLENGITQEAAARIGTPETKGLIDKAYAPCNFEAEAKNLTELTWDTGRGFETISPAMAEKIAFGCRPPRGELAMRIEFALFVQGTTTIAEQIENEGMVIAISKHWETGELSSKPIVPSVAKGYYGQGYHSLPLVTADPDGNVHKILLTLPARTELTIKPSGEMTVTDLNAKRIIKAADTGLSDLTL